MPLEEDNIPLLLTSNIDFRGINNTSNKLIAKEILDIKNVISKIIISTKTNKNRLKKLYKKDKKINTGLIKFNRNKDKDFLKIVADEINTIHNHHKKKSFHYHVLNIKRFLLCKMLYKNKLYEP